MTVSVSCRSLAPSLCFVLLMFLPTALVQAACELTLRWDNDPPFSMELADGSIGGINVDINRSVLQQLGCEVRLVRLPWARALLELEHGRLDVLPGAFRKPEREVYAHFSGAILPPSRNVLFMRRDALALWPVDNLLQLRATAFRLGAQGGVSYGADYQHLMYDDSFARRVVFHPTRQNLWQMIDKGRIDGIIADEHTGRYELHSLGLEERIVRSAVVVSTEAAEVAFSRASVQVDFVQRYAIALQALVADGSYQRVVEYYLHDGPPGTPVSLH